MEDMNNRRQIMAGRLEAGVLKDIIHCSRRGVLKLLVRDMTVFADLELSGDNGCAKGFLTTEVQYTEQGREACLTAMKEALEDLRDELESSCTENAPADEDDSASSGSEAIF
jgi:ribosome-binding factor A